MNFTEHFEYMKEIFRKFTICVWHNLRKNDCKVQKESSDVFASNQLVSISQLSWKTNIAYAQ